MLFNIFSAPEEWRIVLKILVCLIIPQLYLYFDEIRHKAHEEKLEQKIKQLQNEKKDSILFTSSLQRKIINLQSQNDYAYSSYKEGLREVTEKKEREICRMKEDKALKEKTEQLPKTKCHSSQLQEYSKVNDAEAQVNDAVNFIGILCYE